MNEILEKVSSVAFYFSAIWNYKITVVDGGAITVGKIVFALVLAIIGYFLSRRISRKLRMQALVRFKLTIGAAATIEALSFYTLFVFFLLFALRLANVPLTIFTVLGGAVAIGLGFGSQNIIKNFISGIIMLIEQPIAVGDLIEVDGLTGTVVSIGPRSTVIRTAPNADIILPNSSFLEKNVTNWTRGDDRIRAKVSIGIAYGSPTRKVEELLLAVARSNANILSDPEPFVWFVDFAESSMNFELHFWGSLSEIGRAALESEVRFEIERVLREANIVMAFAQRDIHLDSNKPIEVCVVNTKS